MVLFSHKYDNSTDLSISWIDNRTVSFYNGSVNLSVDPNSNATIDGDVLIVTYTGNSSVIYYLNIGTDQLIILLLSNNMLSAMVGMTEFATFTL